MAHLRLDTRSQSMLPAVLVVALAGPSAVSMRTPSLVSRWTARAATRMMALQIPLSDLSVERVRAYTRPDEMIEYLTGQEDQADLHLRRMLATAYASARTPQLAEEHVDAALAADGDDVEMRFLKGVAREHAGEIDEALDAYERVLDAEPENWRALFHVGKISMQARLLVATWCVM